MSKRLFQILDEMNVSDIENNTRLISLHNSVVSMDDKKKGMVVTMGVPTGIVSISKVMGGEQRLVLMVVDGKEFDKLNK